MQTGYVLDSDLIFTSRITGTARALGLDIAVCRTVADLLRRTRERRPGCVLIDLNLDGLNIDDVLAQLQEPTRPFVVGYGSHVHTDVLRHARAAGCDVVLPRSQFVAELQESLPIWFGPAETQG